MLILPAIDLLGGKCVRLKQGDYAEETVYDSDPVAVAQRFEAEGAIWLHVVDLDGAKSGTPQNIDLLKSIVKGTSLKVEFGGGIRSLSSAQEALDAGAERVIVGTKIVTDPGLAEVFFRQFGQQVVAGLDAREGYLAMAGWTQTSDLSVIEVAKRVVEQGAARIIVTDIAKDSMLQGPNLTLLQQVIEAVTIPVIQSGGVANVEDVRSIRELARGICEGVIIGKALYENRLSVSEAIRAASP